MTSRQILFENIFSLSILQAVNSIAPLITLPYLVRVLQPSGFGLLAFAQGVVLYFDFFTDFGFNFSATKSLAANKESPESISRIFWSVISAKLLLMCASATAFVLTIMCTPHLRREGSLFAANGLYLVGTTLFPMWFFQGLEKMKHAVCALAIARLLAAGALICFVRHPTDYVVAGAIQGSVEVTASFLIVPVLFRRTGITWHRPSVAEIYSCLRQAWPAFLANSSLFLSSSSIVVILGLVATNTEVGYYSAADKLTKAALAVLAPFSQALYPHIAAAKYKSPIAAVRMIRSSFLVMLVLSLLVFTATILLAGPFCRIFLGVAFAHSTTILKCLSPMPLLLAMIAVLGTQTMLIFDMEATLAKTVLISTGVGVPIEILLCTYWGAIGAALSSVILAAMIVAGLFGILYSKGLRVWKDIEAKYLPVVLVPRIETE